MPQTERLILDVPQQEDFERYYEIQSDPQTNLFNPKAAMNFERATEAFKVFVEHWTRYGFGSWTIKLKESHMIIGFGGLSLRMYGDELKVNVGYRFDKDHWGKGYATELTKYAINYGLNELHFNEIFAVVRPKHAASIRVLEKSNMKLFGTIYDVQGEENSLVFIIRRSKI